MSPPEFLNTIIQTSSNTVNQKQNSASAMPGKPPSCQLLSRLRRKGASCLISNVLISNTITLIPNTLQILVNRLRRFLARAHGKYHRSGSGYYIPACIHAFLACGFGILSGMRIISFIEDDATIKKILIHLDLSHISLLILKSQIAN